MGRQSSILLPQYRRSDFRTVANLVFFKRCEYLCNPWPGSHLDCYSDLLGAVLVDISLQIGLTISSDADFQDLKSHLLNGAALWMGGDDLPAFQKRSFWGVFGTAICGLFATSFHGWFLLAAADFRAINHDPRTLTEDQNFFIYPVHGDIATSGPVSVYWQATRAAFFNLFGAAGTTFNRDVYVLDEFLSVGSYTDFDKQFVSGIITLTHEITHVLQYRQDGYDLPDYAYDYLFQYCKARFSYTGNAWKSRPTLSKHSTRVSGPSQDGLSLSYGGTTRSRGSACPSRPHQQLWLRTFSNYVSNSASYKCAQTTPPIEHSQRQKRTRGCNPSAIMFHRVMGTLRSACLLTAILCQDPT